MRYSKEYDINQWSNWLDELANSVRDFYNTFNKLPNILEANEHTFSQFEFMVEVSPIGQEIKNVETGLLGNDIKKPLIRSLEFKGECTLSFIINNSFSDKKYLLKFEHQIKEEKSIKKHLSASIHNNELNISTLIPIEF